MGIPGPTEIMLIALVVFFLFGAKKIPQFMRSLGEGIRELRNVGKELDDGDK